MDIINYQLSPYCPICDNRLGGVAESRRGLYCFDGACSFNHRDRDEEGLEASDDEQQEGSYLQAG